MRIHFFHESAFSILQVRSGSIDAMMEEDDIVSILCGGSTIRNWRARLTPGWQDTHIGSNTFRQAKYSSSLPKPSVTRLMLMKEIFIQKKAQFALRKIGSITEKYLFRFRFGKANCVRANFINYISDDDI